MKGKLPIGWKRVPIVGLCEAHVDCVNRTAPVIDRPTPYKMIRTTNVWNGFIDTENVRYVTEETYRKWTRRLIPKRGDVILTREAPLGDVGKVRTDEPVFLGQRLYHFRPDANLLDADFLLYSLLGDDLQGQIRRFGSGSTVEHMRLEDIPKLEVDLPPLEIQRRIASTLSAYDDLIENNQRRIKLLEAMARALYREWFVEFRFPGHEGHPRVASVLGEIPKGWDVKPLSDVCARITDGSHSSPPSVEEGYPMASVKDMHDWGINLENCRRIAAPDFDSLVRNDCKPRKNDVLIAKDGSYLKHTFVVGEEQDVVVLSSIAMLRPNALIRPQYLSSVLRDTATKARLKGIVSGVAIPRIVLKDFRRFPIVVPHQDVQAAWARVVDPAAAACRTLITQNKNLSRTRDLLLPRLLSGQIDVEAG